MKALTAGSLALILGLTTPIVEARDDRPGRGADYGQQDNKGSYRQSPGRGENESHVRHDAHPYPGSASVRGGGGGSRGDRDLNTRIAGWDGGYREPDRRGGAQVQRDDWRSDGRGRDNRPQDSRGRYDSRGHNYGRHDDHRRDGRWDNRHEHGRHRHDDWRRPEWRRDWNHGWTGNRYRAPVRYVYPRGYHAHSWRVGYHLPPVFIVSNWYVDWRAYRLAPPPWGCRWLRVDGDLLLVDERSGEIVDALYGFFYY